MPEGIFESAIKVCSWVIAAFCLLGGLGLLIFPRATVRLNRALNRSFDIEAMVKGLEKPIKTNVDQWVVGHRVVVGIIALVVSIIILLQLVR